MPSCSRKRRVASTAAGQARPPLCITAQISTSQAEELLPSAPMEPSTGMVSALMVIGSRRGLGREGQGDGRPAAWSHPLDAHFLVKPRLQSAGQVPRYPPPREGTAIGDNYALPSQTSEIN